MVAMEDNLGAVIVPRLEQCGADLSRVTFVNEITDEAGQPRPFTLADLPSLLPIQSACARASCISMPFRRSWAPRWIFTGPIR